MIALGVGWFRAELLADIVVDCLHRLVLDGADHGLRALQECVGIKGRAIARYWASCDSCGMAI